MLKVAVFIDQLDLLSILQDTTIMLIRQGLHRNHVISIFHQGDVLIKNGLVYCKRRKVNIINDLIEEGENQYENLNNYDFLFLRKDPPIDIAFQTTMSILSLVESRIIMINSPIGILAFAEKLWPIVFGVSQPPTLVSNSKSDLMLFKNEHQDIVLKPLLDFCGKGVYISLNNDKNFSSVLETLLYNNHGLPIIGQKYLSGVRFGDRRIIMLGGSPIGAINRVANQSDYRCNMKTGGKPSLHVLSSKEKELCESIGLALKHLI